MLSSDIRHLGEQVRFFRDRDLHSTHFLDLLVERLDALGDRAAALEATLVPEAARRTVEASDTVVRLDDVRRARARAGQ